MDRVAARVLVIDEDGRTLLLRGGDPADPAAGTWWFTPGGGVEPGESMLDAAARELREETGLTATARGLHGPIFERDAEFSFDGELFRQHEEYFWVRVPHFEAVHDGWTSLEKRSLQGSRWWSLIELETSEEVVYPPALVELIRVALEHEEPADSSEL